MVIETKLLDTITMLKDTSIIYTEAITLIEEILIQ